MKKVFLRISEAKIVQHLVMNASKITLREYNQFDLLKK